jgi:hypothetical protein
MFHTEVLLRLPGLSLLLRQTRGLLLKQLCCVDAFERTQVHARGLEIIQVQRLLHQAWSQKRIKGVEDR